jgi:hypothetical protein
VSIDGRIISTWNLKTEDSYYGVDMDLREIGSGGIDWIDLAQAIDQWRAQVNTVKNPRVPQRAGKLLSNRATGGFSKSTQLHGVSWFWPCGLNSSSTE